MNTRRSFFKSLAMLGAAAEGCPGIFIPKFEPVKWKIQKLTDFEAFLQKESKRFDELILSEYYGQWKFVIGEGEVAPYHFAIQTPTSEFIDCVFEVRK